MSFITYKFLIKFIAKLIFIFGSFPNLFFFSSFGKTIQPIKIITHLHTGHKLILSTAKKKQKSKLHYCSI